MISAFSGISPSVAISPHAAMVSPSVSSQADSIVSNTFISAPRRADVRWSAPASTPMFMNSLLMEG